MLAGLSRWVREEAPAYLCLPGCASRSSDGRPLTHILPPLSLSAGPSPRSRLRPRSCWAEISPFIAGRPARRRPGAFRSRRAGPKRRCPDPESGNPAHRPFGPGRDDRHVSPGRSRRRGGAFVSGSEGRHLRQQSLPGLRPGWPRGFRRAARPGRDPGHGVAGEGRDGGSVLSAGGIRVGLLGFSDDWRVGKRRRHRAQARASRPRAGPRADHRDAIGGRPGRGTAPLGIRMVDVPHAHAAEPGAVVCRGRARISWSVTTRTCPWESRPGAGAPLRTGWGISTSDHRTRGTTPSGTPPAFSERKSPVPELSALEILPVCTDALRPSRARFRTIGSGRHPSAIGVLSSRLGNSTISRCRRGLPHGPAWMRGASGYPPASGRGRPRRCRRADPFPRAAPPASDWSPLMRSAGGFSGAHGKPLRELHAGRMDPFGPAAKPELEGLSRGRFATWTRLLNGPDSLSRLCSGGCSRHSGRGTRGPFLVADAEGAGRAPVAPAGDLRGSAGCGADGPHSHRLGEYRMDRRRGISTRGGGPGLAPAWAGARLRKRASRPSSWRALPPGTVRRSGVSSRTRHGAST